MNSYMSLIREKIEKIPYNHLLISSDFYREFDGKLSELTYAKCLERLTKSGEIIHLAKGVYYRPKLTRFGIVPISENDIAAYYTKALKGIEIGYGLYNRKGITTQVGKKITILSQNIKEDCKHISNVSIQRISIDLNVNTIPAIETLEILQNYNNIEDISIRGLVEYMNDFSHKYSDTAIEEVLQSRKYKKSTIAFLAAFLDHMNVKNNLHSHLSPLSNYKIPDVEELYGIT